MQKKLLAVAVAGALAMPAVALAQVTVFGTIDTGVRNQTKAVFGTGDESEMFVTNGLRTTNRWGLRGSEDLGNKLMANFHLEGSFRSDTGAIADGLFARKIVVGLSQGGNSVDLGRDYTVNFKTQGIYEPMSYTYPGITPTAGTNTADTRFSNLVTAGFRFGTGGVRVDYVMGEAVGVDTGDGFGVNGDFAFGPVTLGAAYSTVSRTATLSNTTTNFGGAYKMGAFTFRAGMSDTAAEQAVGETNSPMFVLGVQYAISPTMNGRVGYYNTKFESTTGAELGTRKLAIVALDYIMSKRTTAYVAFDRHNLTGNQVGTAVLGTPSNDGATGISAGIAHSF